LGVNVSPSTTGSAPSQLTLPEGSEFVVRVTILCRFCPVQGVNENSCLLDPVAGDKDGEGASSMFSVRANRHGTYVF
jgi:hypothetical protein